ncbi:hypothetical protein LOCC1_G004278 [Lachnellula occidentalis]|uniref:Uncharacterized protein n=1 Tax=Lachnellula occidentalis TaxID=215460 RepID=A0A8H8RZJ7_9HELO|nr:hypothetical protein LOCC1_G004278 [Lachnellula occidentalis]
MTDLSEILADLTLDEKIALLSGKIWWRSKNIKREGLLCPTSKQQMVPMELEEKPTFQEFERHIFHLHAV